MKDQKNLPFSLFEAKQKLEYYCAYQERCHQEVANKLYELKMSLDEANAVIVHLIEHNFLNEERFACSFARGKHRIKHWGKIRIVNELKFKQISTYNINKALLEFTADEYLETFNYLANHHWETIRETNFLKKSQISLHPHPPQNHRLVYQLIHQKHQPLQ